MVNRQACAAAIFVVAFVALLGCSFYYLYNSPTVGIDFSWDKPNNHYDVLSAKRWSALRAGDIVLRIGGLEAGFHLLLTDNIHIQSRDELFAWIEAKRQICRTLMTSPVVFTVERGGKILDVPVIPRKAELSFLGHLELLHVLVGIVFFLIGLIVFYKQRATEQGAVFFGMCVLLMIVFVTNATSLMSEMIYDPDYLAFTNIVNIISLLLANAAVLHFALLLPGKRKFLGRFPMVVHGFYAVNLVVAGSLQVPIMNFLLPSYGMLAFGAVLQAFLTYRQGIDRQQMRWVGAGFVFGLAPWIFINAIPMLITGNRLMTDTIPAAFVVCIPLSMAFAIQKYRLLDIDALLEGTFVLIVTMLLLGIVDLALMGLLATHFRDSLSDAPATVVFLSKALTVSLYAALRDRVRLMSLKLLKRDGSHEEAVLASFADRARGLTPGGIKEMLVATIQEAFRPQKLLIVDRGSRDGDSLIRVLHGELSPVNLWERPPGVALPSSDLYVALPFGKDREVHHLLLLGALPKGRFYSRHHWTLLKALLTQANFSYENALLYQENLDHHNARLVEQQRHLQEKEKMLKDLHDGIGGIATNVSLLAELAQHKTSLEDIKGPLATIASLSRESLSEIHSFIQSLDPREANAVELSR